MILSFVMASALMVPDPLKQPAEYKPAQIELVGWEARFAITGRPPPRWRKKLYRRFRSTIVVEKCVPVYKPPQTSNEEFCDKAGEVTKRPDLCFTIHTETKEQCEKKLQINTQRYRRVIDYKELLYSKRRRNSKYKL